MKIRIETVSEREAAGELREIFDAWFEKNPDRTVRHVFQRSPIVSLAVAADGCTTALRSFRQRPFKAVEPLLRRRCCRSRVR
jgi:hypothetical protein